MKSIKQIKVRLLIPTLAVLSLVWSTFAFAATIPDSGKIIPTQKDRLIDEIFQKSGIDDSINQVDSLFMDADQLKNTNLPFGHSEFIFNVLVRVYSKSEYRLTLKEQFQRKYKPQHVQRVLKWYRSPLAKRIVQMELAAMSPYTNRRAKRYIRDLEDQTLKEQRLKILGQMESSVGYTDYSVETLKIFAGIMFPFETSYKGKPVAALIESVRKELQEPLRKRILDRWLYIYRELPNEELLDYSKFIRSAAGKWFHKTMFDGSETGMIMLAIRAKDYQRKLYAEVEEKGADHLLLREIAPPGHRYSLIRKRDPFAPLVIDGVLQVARKPKVKSRGKTKRKFRPKASVDSRGYGRELRSSPNIPWELYKKIRMDNPDLYADLEFYGKLFQDKKKLKVMSKSEYRRSISKYRGLIARANETKLMPTPLQINYKSIKLVGVIWKKQEMVALVEVKGSKGQSVKKGFLIGPNYGVVDAVRRDEIIVLEKSRDYLGNILTTKKSIEFYTKGSQEEG